MPGDRVPCPDAVRLATEYLEGSLIPGLEKAMVDHLDGCPPCREYLAQLRATAGLLRRLSGGEELDDEEIDRIIRRVRTGDA